MKKLRADWTQGMSTSIKPTMVFCSFLSQNIQIKIHRGIILAAVFYGCETWSLTWRELQRLMVFVNMVLGKISGPKKDRVTGEWWSWEDMICTPHQILIRWSNQEEWHGWGMWCVALCMHFSWRYILERRDAYRVLVGNLKGRQSLCSHCTDWSIIKYTLRSTFYVTIQVCNELTVPTHTYHCILCSVLATAATHIQNSHPSVHKSKMCTHDCTDRSSGYLTQVILSLENLNSLTPVI